MYKKLSKEFKEQFQQNTDQELIATFNQYVGNKGWCSAKGVFIRALREEIVSRNFRNTQLIISSEGGLMLSKKVMLMGNRLEHIPLDPIE